MARARIQIVEDERVVALNIQNRLEKLGYAVTANVASGEEAIQKASETLPDLVLMDIKLQGKFDGIEAASQIQTSLNIPVVYITAYTDDDTLARAKLTEPYGYILKPFETRELCTTIEIVLHKHKMEQQLRSREQFMNQELETRVVERTSELRLVNEQLRMEIAQRQRLEAELQLALEKERELSELKSRIVSTISHEYRTPLTTILLSSELLRQYSSTWAEPRKIKHFQRIQEAVQRMSRMVNDALLIDQGEARKQEFNPTLVDVEKLVFEWVKEVRLNTSHQHTILFEHQGSCNNTLLDEKLLQLIFNNLLSNAIKYSSEGSTLKLELVCSLSQIVFRISDQGIGIPIADQAQLFTAFHRGSNVGTIPGVGLGLAIVKQCVDVHGGEIITESEVGVGTTFTVTLPRPESLELDN